MSAIIIARILKYFLETDYSLNEDYGFTREDMRQFYIRREILRSIAAHTCDDIYLLYMGSFAFLLRICDDTQEWGRKYISELYTPSSETYELKNTSLNFNDAGNRCNVTEKIDVSKGGDAAGLFSLVQRFYKQSLTYITVFRDGLDTRKRDFSFKRMQTIANSDVTIELTLNIAKESAAELRGEVRCWTDAESANEPYRKELCEEIRKRAQKYKEAKNFLFRHFGFDGKYIKNDGTEFSKWQRFEFQLPLVNESGYL